jgi:hypothetical protein
MSRFRSTRSAVLNAILIGLVAYAAVVGLLYVLQRQLMYLPDTGRPDLVKAELPGLSEVQIATRDGLQLLSWYRPAPAGGKTIAYFHGNGGHIGYRAARARIFAEAGYGVFLLSYRGYGSNAGKPTEEGLYADARAALDFLVAQGIPPERTILYGESLGTAVAVRMAVERKVAAVILEAPFTSAASLAQHHYPFVPAKWLLQDRFDSSARIAEVRAPILVLHGTEDRVTPSRFGETLFAAAREPKELHLLSGAGHVEAFRVGASQIIADFMRRHVAP